MAFSPAIDKNDSFDRDLKESKKIALWLDYDGTMYHGFQLQKNAITIQFQVEAALSKLFNQAIKIFGCSRTDAGVHAKGQVCHFESPFFIPLEKLPLAINTYLPRDIRVRQAQVVGEDFHARFSAQGKRYVYRIWNDSIMTVWNRQYMAHVPGRLDWETMEKAAALLQGKHDFRAFSSFSPQWQQPIRQIDSIHLRSSCQDIIDPENLNYFYGLVEIEVKGKSFLYNMVRILAGTIIYAGQGKISLEQISVLLDNPDRKKAGKTMPSKGLTLEEIFYTEPLFGSAL